MNQGGKKNLGEMLEKHPVKTIGGAALGIFVAGFGTAAWLLFYAYIPSQLNELREQLKQAKSVHAPADRTKLVDPKEPIAAPSIQLGVTPTAVPTVATTLSSPIPATTVPSSPSANSQKRIGLSLEELEQKWVALSDRFAEQAAFLEQYEKGEVTWDVSVQGMQPAPEIVILFFGSSGGQLRGIANQAIFNAGKKGRLLTLRRGDHIRLKGVLSISGGRFVVYAEDYTLLAQATATPLP